MFRLLDVRVNVNVIRFVAGGPDVDVDDDLEEVEESEEEEVDPEEVLGQYTLDGALFVQGNWHEDLLVSGTECEVFIDNKYIFNEEDVEWRPAEVAQVQVKTIKFKDASGDVKNRSIRAYTVKVRRSDGSELVLPIDPKEIRLRAPKPPVNPPTAAEQAAIEKTELEGVKDAGWSTVSVSMVPAEEDIIESKVKLEDGIARPVKVEDEPLEKEADKKETEVLDDANDAYATFNPFGGDYKGFKIERKEELRSGFDKDPGEVSAFSTGATEGKKVKFRSRKKKKRTTMKQE